MLLVAHAALNVTGAQVAPSSTAVQPATTSVTAAQVGMVNWSVIAAQAGIQRFLDWFTGLLLAQE